MKKNNILVSIIITTHNRSSLLPRAIKSVINQTYKNIEIIIVDDCSSDNTVEVIKNFQKIDTRIKYLRNTSVSGANVSRNNGINLSKGEFIAGLDDDDEFLPNRIERLICEYDDNYSFITSLNIINRNDKVSYSKCPSQIKLDDLLKNNILMNQALIKKSRLLEINLYDEKLSAYQDYDVWMRLVLKYGTVKVLQEYLQIVYFDIGRQRITTSYKKRFYGYFNWYKKYSYLMNSTLKKNHLSFFYTIRSKNISDKFFNTLLTRKNYLQLINLYKNGIINYEVIQNINKQINKIDKSKQYVLYGYGSMGKYVLTLLKENIIAIIDKDLKNYTQIEGIPIITLDDLSQEKYQNIIITPIPYKEEIENSLNEYNINIISIF